MEGPRPIRLRLVLPAVFVGLSVTLWTTGELQAWKAGERIETFLYLEDLQLRKQLPNSAALLRLQDSTRGGGTLTNLYQLATSWELDRAINGSAFIASLSIPFSQIGDLPAALGIPNMDFWCYWALIAGIWFFFGYELDKRQDQKRNANGRPRIWNRRLLSAILITYGLFLCYRAQEYLSPSYVFGILFPVSLLGWGVGLMFAGVCPYSHSRRRLWRLFYGSLALLVGTAEWYCGYHFILRSLSSSDVAFEFVRSARITMLILFFVWGAFLILGGLYLFLPVWRGLCQHKRELSPCSGAAS